MLALFGLKIARMLDAPTKEEMKKMFIMRNIGKDIPKMLCIPDI